MAIAVWIVRLQFSKRSILHRSLAERVISIFVDYSYGPEVEIGDTWRHLAVKLTPLNCPTWFSVSVPQTLSVDLSL